MHAEKYAEARKKAKCRFPIARIKKIMQIDDEIGKVSTFAPIVISHAIELFLISLLKAMEEEANGKCAKKIILAHLEACVEKDPKLEFIKGLLQRK
ncbi:Dr1-associated corepressor [Nematocida ausubeli]|uniref:Transcription factor CBF/NF-Y/archaeal histone domain-containing protein n=1 Tax=Nematocida ausubeli (strain ATCC PRA-371 / ERTm2) TaxID=1913371 RepID=H8ZA28_NEMA1|nr:uncharacterized protein NESG_00659 [Nematocida ausubeli]EHY66809.1 hypothetical protein NERG_00449 [Nematocida ausubeli]KAI5132353.1 Dr1-associated corepressor [Nematocida ausubeli]KAI5132935.1 Dr1-associated corepressor [Nematocida ausubeli]KAI5146900.1 Dr1-associated corepressor [Nematocida ausubeli]KAI5164366.1 Dr1-associated corepressor [Nematocida ausubeli]